MLQVELNDQFAWSPEDKTAASTASRTECRPETSEAGEKANETWAGEHSSYILTRHGATFCVCPKNVNGLNSKARDQFVQ